MTEYKLLSAGKILFMAAALMLITACKDKGIDKCEQHFKNSTYKYKEACQCLKKSSKDNHVDDFEDFIVFITDPSNQEKFKSAFMANALGATVSPKLKTYTTAISDGVVFCHLKDNEIIQDNILMQNEGRYLTEVSGINTILTKDEKKELIDDKEFRKALYKDLTFSGLADFALSKVKNVNVKNFLISTNLKEGYKKFDTVPDNIKAIILSLFNSDFGRAYYYFHNRLKMDKQEALDQAYVQALVVVSMCLNDAKIFEKYYSDFNEVYKNEKLGVIVFQKHIDIIKKFEKK